MTRSGPVAFYVTSEPGRFKTDPFSFTCGLWMLVQGIRINPTSLKRSEDSDPPALGWINFVGPWFFLFFSVFVFPASCAYVFATWTSCAFKFLYKNSKKLPYVSWYVFIVLWCFHTLKWIKSMGVNFIGFTCFNDFCEFSCTIMDPIFAPWCWYLIFDFCDVFISEFMLFLHSCMPNC